ITFSGGARRRRPDDKQQGVTDEPRTHVDRDTQGRVRRDIGWDAQELGRQWPPLRGLGDLPPEGIAGGPESSLRVTVELLVRAADPALERRWEDVGGGGQQVRVRGRNRHASVV